MITVVVYLISLSYQFIGLSYQSYWFILSILLVYLINFCKYLKSFISLILADILFPSYSIFLRLYFNNYKMIKAIKTNVNFLTYKIIMTIPSIPGTSTDLKLWYRR